MPDDERVLEVRINGLLADPGAVVRFLADGSVLVPAEDARRWRLSFDDSLLVVNEGQRFLPLAAVPGIRPELDGPRSLLMLFVDPSALAATTLAMPGDAAPRPDDVGFGAFVNYDLLVQRSTVDTSNGAQLRFGVFNGFGLLTSEHSFARGERDIALRLMTALRKDFPDRLDTLVVGDFSSAPGTIGQAALIGGVQWGTNFSLQPSLVTFPFQRLAGEATLPSTVDVYLNGAFRNRLDVPPGPFEIDQIPVITGDGTLHMVVIDSLGRSVTVEQPFYATTQLLRPGLHEQSWEVGALREDFGIASNRYGRAVAITTHRWGLTDRYTAEIRAEALRDQQMAGAGIAALAGRYGVLRFNLAYGGGPDGFGGRATVGFQGQWGQFSAAAEFTGTETAFRQAGDGHESARPPASSAAVTFGWAGGYLGSFGLALVAQDSRSGPDAELVNLSWTREIGARGHLSLAYFEDFAVKNSRGVALTITRALGDRTSSSLTVDRDAGERQRIVAQAQRSLDRHPGWGWHLRADDQLNGSAEFALQRDYGMYRIGTDRFADNTRAYLGATGALVSLSRALAPTRRIDSAFGLVRVPGMANVRVYFENTLSGVTDRDGELLLPWLHPYQANEVRIEVEDLPFEAIVASDRVSSVPSYRSGVVFHFPVRIERSATLTLIQPDGRPVPAGARLQLGGGSDIPVGAAGYVFVTTAEEQVQLVATWDSGACSARLELPSGADAQPDLGRITCQPVAIGQSPQ
jgi:outer membrane usher protein